MDHPYLSIINLRDAFAALLSPEAKRVFLRKEFSTIIEYNDTNWKRRVAPVQFLVQPTEDINFQTMHYRRAGFTSFAPIFATHLNRMAHVYNRCIKEGWLAHGTFCQCLAVPVPIPGKLAVNYQLVIASGSGYNHHQLNDMLGGYNLFVPEDSVGNLAGWKSYERDVINKKD